MCFQPVLVIYAFLENYYISSSELSSFDSSQLLISNDPLNYIFNDKSLLNSNGRFFVTYNENGTLFHNTANYGLTQKITSNHFVENFFAHQSVNLWSGTAAHEQKFGKIAGTYFDKSKNKLLTGYLTLPVYNNPDYLETRTDCSFEYFDTPYASYSEPNTKCPIISENGEGFITNQFVKIGNSYWNIENSIAIFSKDRSGYADYAVFTKNAVYLFRHNNNSSQFLLHKFDITSTGKASGWEDTSVSQRSCADTYITSDFDSKNMFMAFKKNCHEFISPAPLKSDGSMNDFNYFENQLAKGGSPVDCVSVVQIPLDIIFNPSHTVYYMDSDNEIPFDIQVVYRGAGVTFYQTDDDTKPVVAITPQTAKKTISSIKREVVPTDDVFARSAQNPSNNASSRLGNFSLIKRLSMQTRLNCLRCFQGLVIAIFILSN